MKKNFITFITALSMLIPTAAVFAEDIPEDLLNQPASAEDTLGDPIIQGDIMLINGVDGDIMPVQTLPSYISNTVTVTSINDESIETVLEGQDAENFDNVINYTITDATVVFGMADGEKKSLEDVKAGDTITVFTNAYAPAPLILPPQYQANVIMVNDNEKISSERFADVDTYVLREETLTNASNTLALNLDESVKIVDTNGKAVDAKDLFDKDLLVVYSTSTKSIPAQTTPITIVVLGENEMALAQLHQPAALEETPAPEATDSPEDFEVDFSKITTVKVGNETITNVYTDANGNLMLPLRKITETLGFTVEWDGNLRAVMLNGGMYSLKIGENSYVKGRMMPQELSVAPEITNDLTFVPVDYFTDILEMTANIDGDATLVLENN